MPHEMLLLAILVLPFAGSCFAAVLRVDARNPEAWLAGTIALVGFGLVAATYPNVINGGAIQLRLEWIPDLGLEFVLRLDGFAWAFAMLVTGIGFLVVLYARYYMSPTIPCRASSRSSSRSWGPCWASCCPATCSSSCSFGN